MLYTLLEYIKTTTFLWMTVPTCSLVWATSRSGLEGHVLVGGEESHELWHLDDLDASTLVDIEVSPGFWEVGGEVGLLGGTGESDSGRGCVCVSVAHGFLHARDVKGFSKWVDLVGDGACYPHLY